MGKIIKKLFLIFILTIPNTLYAQMFSVSERKEKINLSNNYLRIGTAISAFEYLGSLNEVEHELLEINKTILGVSFETELVTTNITYGNSLFGIKNGRFIDLNLILSQEVNIIQQRKINIGLPFELNGGITSSNNELSKNNFHQNYYSAGSGIFVNIQPKKKININNHIVFGYGLSNSNSGFFGGTINYVKGGTRFNFINFMYEKNLSIGYDYIFRTYDIEGEIYDYEYKGHLITMGISF